MPSPSRLGESFSSIQAAFAGLLVIGLYFPTSTDGEHSVLATLMAFSILLSLLIYMSWTLGVRDDAFQFISLPIVLLPMALTFLRVRQGPFEIDLGIVLKYFALAMVLALDLRRFRPSRLVKNVFALVNLLNLSGGVAILVGSEWIAEFLPKYYWIALSELVPAMVALHKPVLTFGTHSLSACFVYLFFWINWQEFQFHAKKLSLFFALNYFLLLLGLTSFTAIGFAALAIAQMTLWSWKCNPRLTAGVVFSILAAVPILSGPLAEQVDSLVELPQIADEAFLNSDFSGPVARYGSDGALRPAMNYLLDHPFSPIGFARSGTNESPSRFFLGDSGTLEFLLRGSVPLLLLAYLGLYLFLSQNLFLRSHALTLFFVMILFETGFELVIYFRTLFLLPFFVVYLNHTASVSVREPLRAVAL